MVRARAQAINTVSAKNCGEHCISSGVRVLTIALITRIGWHPTIERTITSDIMATDKVTGEPATREKTVISAYLIGE